MRPYQLLLAVAATLAFAVPVALSIEVTPTLILAAPLVVFVVLALVTTVDKIVFLNYRRSLERDTPDPKPLTEAEMLDKFVAASDDSTKTRRQTLQLSLLVLVALCLLTFLYSSLLFS